MKRPLALLLLFILLLPLLLAGCTAKPSEEEIFSEVERLVPATVLINGVFLGEGIPTGGEAFDGYLYADEGWMAETGLGTVEALLSAAYAVYSDEVVSMLSRYACFNDEEELPHYRNKATEDGLFVLAARQGMYTGLTHEYLLDTLTLRSVGSRAATVELTVRITRSGETQERVLALPLVREDDGWRLDKLTYVAFTDVD